MEPPPFIQDSFMTGNVTDDFALGIDGFSFADLYEPTRLKDLHAKFWVFAA